MTNFNFPNGIDNFTPTLVNDLTVVNADHVNDLRVAITSIQNALVGVGNFPYSNTSIVQVTDNIKEALEKLDKHVSDLEAELDFQDGYSDSRLDKLEDLFEAHRKSQGPVDEEGYGVHGVDGYVVGTKNSQNLVNKTYDSGTDHAGPKFIARAGPSDAGLRQFEVYNQLGNLSAWIDEKGDAFFAGDLTIMGDEKVQDIQRVTDHLIVDGYTILGDSSQTWTTTINGDLTINGSNVQFNSTNSFNYSGKDASFGNGTGTFALDFINTEVEGNLSVSGNLSVDGITSLGDSNDPLTIQGNVDIFGGDLSVQGESRFLGTTYIGDNKAQDDLFITVRTFNIDADEGFIDFDGYLNVGGTLTVGKLVVGDIIGSGTNYQFGDPSTSSANQVDINANTIISETLTVSGDITGNDLTANNQLNVASDASIGGDLTVTGDTTFGSGSTTTSINGNLTISGDQTLSGDLDTTGTISANLFKATTGYEVDTLNSPLEIGTLVGNSQITLGAQQTLTLVEGRLTSKLGIKTKNLDVLSPSNNLSIGASVGNAFINFGGNLTTSIFYGDIFAEGNITLFSPSPAIDVNIPKNLTIGAGIGSNTFTLGGSSSYLHIPGNLTVDGYFDTKDPNITLNKNGTDGTAEGAGITIDRDSANLGSFIYDSDATTKFKLGDIGYEREIVDIDSPQTLSNKNFTSSSFTGDLIPAADNTYDLGSDSKKWKDLHLGNSLIVENPSPFDGYTATIKNSTSLDGYINLTLPQETGTFALTKDIPEPFKTDVLEPTGFPNRTSSTISFNEGTREFTIGPTGSQYHFWINGDKYVRDGYETVTIPDVEGQYFIYFEDITGSDAQLVVDPAPPMYNLFSGVAYVAIVYWDADNNRAVIFGDERHGIAMDWATHKYLHQTEGARYESGFSITNADVDGDGSQDNDVQIGLSSGRIKDEDIEHNIINASAPATDPYEQVLDPIAEIPVLYRDGYGGPWRKDTATQFPLKQGTTRIEYNIDDGYGNWSTEEVPEDGYFIASWVVATNDIQDPVVVILGQEIDASIEDARDGNKFGSLALGDLPTPETRLLYRLIFETDSGFTNTPSARLRDISDFRTVAIAGAGFVASSDHGALGGLSDDDHAQYLSKDGRPGGQIAYGGVDSNDNLTLHSTLNVAKGEVILADNARFQKAQYINVASGISIDHVVDSTDHVIPVDTQTAVNDITITFPLSSSEQGRLIVVADVGGEASLQNIIIQASGSDTIMGQQQIIIDGDYFSLTFVSDGAGRWIII